MVSTRSWTVVALVAGAALIGGCSTTDSHADAPDAPHWGYTGADGPAHWGSLSPEFATCAEGTRQSPIDIVHPTTGTGPAPVARYRTGSAKVVNNGHTVQADARASGALTFGDGTYDLVQMHFHSPSETTFAGAHAPVEVHFVNTDVAGKSLVLAATIEPGPANVSWQPFVDALGVAKGKSRNVDLDWARLLPSDLSATRFDGSLTTPPCTEGLTWLVVTTPITMSPAQIDTFEHAYSGNNRPTQPLNGRTVVQTAASTAG